MISWQVTRQFLIHSPHRNFPLRSVGRQLLVLLEFHRGYDLIFGCPSRNLVLDRVSCVDQQLSHAAQTRSGSPWVFGNGTMARHEDLRSERLHRIQHSQP